MEKRENLGWPLQQEGVGTPTEGRFSIGLTWGLLLSIPLWISSIGWIMTLVK